MSVTDLRGITRQMLVRPCAKDAMHASMAKFARMKDGRCTAKMILGVCTVNVNVAELLYGTFSISNMRIGSQWLLERTAATY